MTEHVAIGFAIVALLVGVAAIVIELRRLGDLAEAVNNAIERIAVELKKRKP